jgi:hypothetical protein
MLACDVVNLAVFAQDLVDLHAVALVVLVRHRVLMVDANPYCHQSEQWERAIGEQLIAIGVRS